MLFTTCVSLMGCAGDDAFGPIPDSEQSYWRLRLNHTAIQLSLHPPHHTIQLETVAYTPAGDIWTPPAQMESQETNPPVIYISTDSTKVRVTQDGLVRAWGIQTGSVYVIASRTLHGITHADSALVRVSDVTNPPVLETFQLKPESTDSAKIAIGSGTKVLPVILRDTGGTRMTGYPVSIVLDNPSIVSLPRFSSTASVSAFTGSAVPGQTVITASTWVYGVAKRDTFTFTIGYPLKRNFGVGVGALLTSGVVFSLLGGVNSTVGPGATVGWYNGTGCKSEQQTACVTAGFVPLQNGQPIDIVFDDPTHILPATNPTQNTGGGNILGIPSDTTLDPNTRIRYRTIRVPGTYRYRVNPLGLTGTLIVHPF